jgi:hypothetical protein
MPRLRVDHKRVWFLKVSDFFPILSIAFRSEEPQILRMITVTRRRRLCCWSIRSTSVALALLVCASAFADPSKNVVVAPTGQAAQKRVTKVCYVRSTASGVPLPCNWFGAFPTTANPIEIIGRATEK